MTEDEAKTKACCGGPGCGKWVPQTKEQMQHGIPSQRLCIGSACMAWRWTDDWEYKQDSFKRVDTSKKKATKSKTDGRCGLAGKL